jgi:hypothetical protein
MFLPNLKADNYFFFFLARLFGLVGQLFAVNLQLSLREKEYKERATMNAGLFRYLCSLHRASEFPKCGILGFGIA